MGRDSTAERLADAGASSGPERDAGNVPKLKLCPSCRQRYSGDLRFCPFDGEKLELSVAYIAASDRMSGSVIDQRYVVLSLLGEGGMGTVYRVRHRALGRLFALKALKAELSRDSALSARFIQEAKAAAAVSHPNVVQIIDFGALPTGQPYFVMELLLGVSLCRAIASDGPFDPQRTVHIARQVAEALGAAHRVGIIHRDLKPDNIHITTSPTGRGLVKVLDFGLAKIAGGSSLTRAGMVFGTPHYMSPEQASGEPVDHRADIYALGVVMYEMLAGRVPFESDTYMGVLTKHMYAEPPRPSAVAGREQHSQLEEVVLRCLSKHPEARFDSMAALIHELDRAFPTARTGSGESLSVTATPVGGANARAAHSRLYRPWLWLAGAMALAGLGAIAVHLGSDRTSPTYGTAPPYGTTGLPDESIGPVSPALAASPETDKALFPKPASTAAGEAGTSDTAPDSSRAVSDAPRTARPGHRGHAPATRHTRRPSTRVASPADTTGEIIDPWAEKQR